MPAMIHGIFDFFWAAAAGGNGADGAGAVGAGWTIGTSAVIAPESRAAGVGGGGGFTGAGGGGGAGGCVAGGRAISDVFGLVGPVLRGSATVVE